MRILDYGIPYLLEYNLRTYINACRRTGRTEYALDQLKDGDILVVALSSYASSLNAYFKTKRRNVKVISASSVDSLYTRLQGMPKTNLIFDHTFVEQVYEGALKCIKGDLEAIVRHQAKDYDEVKISTSQEIARHYG